ncbi:tripartite-type tricarboxylate transporter receptor subunit TctC [Rhodoligotrophos appendicifer]|uniref:tripartite tricarboxylate transporter substrate binding protein BugD n=1 Tax=Rhodoligotrophos appendicifer TaxID=987056 RepID=UPI001186C9FA|nr:tripartite tricarboxylate transporter substrate binding protein BugD [Rhodoligotrophos appendicifer]
MSLAKWLAVSIVAASVATASAQETYPTGPVTVIVPFSAGGPTDTVTRLIAEPMGKELGQQVVVQNVGGAGGTLGAGQAAKAAPDGQTLLLHHIGMSTAPTLYRNLAYNPVTDFEPIGMVTDVPMVIVARKDFPANNLKELIEYVKANKDKVTYANAGIGAASHLCGMLFMEAIGTELTTVPYQGTGPALTDLVGGQVDLMCDQTTNTTGQIKGGEIKAYAVTTKERLASLPDLPTAAEAGLPDFTVGVWHGLYAPAGTPKPVIDKLSASLQTALKDPNVVKRFGELGTVPSTSEQATPQALKDQLSSQIALWKPIIDKAGVYAQ